MEKIIESNKEQDTYDLGYELGQHAKPGQVFTLVGDLGVGKTVFTKGLAAGLGITEPVSSPTFTIVQVYDEGRLPFYHFDVYRIGDVEEMDEIGYEDYVYGEGVSLIECGAKKNFINYYKTSSGDFRYIYWNCAWFTSFLGTSTRRNIRVTVLCIYLLQSITNYSYKTNHDGVVYDFPYGITTGS